MTNRLIPFDQFAREMADDMNAIAMEYGVPALDLARLFGASIGAPIDVSDLLEEAE